MSNAYERRRRRMQRVGVGAAVEKIEEQRQPDDFFGHRKSEGEQTQPNPPRTRLKILKRADFCPTKAQNAGNPLRIIEYFNAGRAEIRLFKARFG